MKIFEVKVQAFGAKGFIVMTAQESEARIKAGAAHTAVGLMFRDIVKPAGNLQV